MSLEQMRLYTCASIKETPSWPPNTCTLHILFLYKCVKNTGRPRKSKRFHSQKKVLLEIFLVCTGNDGLLRPKEYGGSRSSWWLSCGLRNCRSWAPLVEILAIKFPLRVFLQVVLALLRHLTEKNPQDGHLGSLMVLFPKGLPTCQGSQGKNAWVASNHAAVPCNKIHELNFRWWFGIWDGLQMPQSCVVAHQCSLTNISGNELCFLGSVSFRIYIYIYVLYPMSGDFWFMSIFWFARFCQGSLNCDHEHVDKLRVQITHFHHVYCLSIVVFLGWGVPNLVFHPKNPCLEILRWTGEVFPQWPETHGHRVGDQMGGPRSRQTARGPRGQKATPKLDSWVNMF